MCIRDRHDLMQRNDIVICNADKGGATVIVDVKDYIKEANKELDDEKFYKKLPTDPTHTNLELINNTIDHLMNKNLFSEELANGLKVTESRTAIFYLLPKIHKVGNPGRPVVSSIDCHTSKISEFIDHHLQPIVQSTRSYVKDTNDMGRK